MTTSNVPVYRPAKEGEEIHANRVPDVQGGGSAIWHIEDPVQAGEVFIIEKKGDQLSGFISEWNDEADDWVDGRTLSAEEVEALVKEHQLVTIHPSVRRMK